MRVLPPADLRDQIHGELLKQIRPPARRTWRLPAFQFPGWAWPTLAGAVAVLLLWFGSNVFLNANRSTNSVIATVTGELVSDHMRSLLANHLIDVVSTDQHTVKPWLAGKLNFSPPVYDFTDHDFTLISGMFDYLENQEIAAVVFQHRQ